MINNCISLFLLSHLGSEGFYREASTIKPVAFLKFDVAKLGWDARENKKITSTAHLCKLLINSVL